MRNLIEHYESANAIVDMLAQEIEEDKLQWASLPGLVSDGASVFTGKRGRVDVKLKKKQEKHIMLPQKVVYALEQLQIHWDNLHVEQDHSDFGLSVQIIPKRVSNLFAYSTKSRIGKA